MVEKKCLMDRRHWAPKPAILIDLLFELLNGNSASMKQELSYPTKLKVVDSTKSSITLEWVKPVYDGGSNITGYVVEKREQGEEDWTMISSKGEIRTTEYVVSHLKPGINYFFRVSALNCAGTGEPLEMTEPVQAKDIIEECEIDLDVALRTQITAKAGENVEILIPFKGRPAPNVTWRKGEKNITQDPRYHISNTESSTLLTIEQVTRDDSGKYVLSIENGVGEPKTSFVNIKVFDTPGPCQKLIVKHVSRGNVTLAWEPPLINGGSEITNYVIEKRDATKRAYSSVTTKCAHTTFKISGLSEKTPFFFRVLAENETGLGEPCETAEPVKATEVPGPIKDLSMKDSTKTSLPYKGKPRPTMQWLKDNLPLKEMAPNIEFGAEHFEGLTVKAGESIRLKVSVTGRPVPQVAWFKDGKEIDKKMAIDVTTVIGSSSIFIRDSDRSHRGVYSVEAKNSSGTKKVDINVRVHGTYFRFQLLISPFLRITQSII
uniref:Titin n=1 Tax=Erpetoichthys calabaricus TaxID=27687 RepID=A0A8C4X806_ERPCA